MCITLSDYKFEMKDFRFFELRNAQKSKSFNKKQNVAVSGDLFILISFGCTAIQLLTHFWPMFPFYTF